jgi:hypothetical protein
MESQAQQPLSAYRGQAQSGRGEGPSMPVAHGEQYLQGTDDTLFEDEELLRVIRPWMTLDSAPADHQSLQDQLEAWSCFSQGGKLFVVRLASAGIYDRRAAYFSHARAFLVDDPCNPSDPGVYLGCSAVFDPTQDQLGESNATLFRLSPSDMPAHWLTQLRTQASAATSFLAHLLQAMEQPKHPLLIAAPLEEFKTGSALYTLISFARAALPANLKEHCKIRLYTRQPGRFIRNLAANLVALPDDNIAEALSAQAHATLLDHQGKVLKTSRPLDPAVEAYAKVAVAGALNQPQGLLPFSAFVGQQRKRDLRADDVDLLQLDYILAMALAGDAADREEVFRDYMRTKTPILPWEKLLDDGDWMQFPVNVLSELVLAHPDLLRSDGERKLQSIVTQVMERLHLTLDNSLSGWWQQIGQGMADGSHPFQRLMQLLAEHPNLFHDRANVAEQTRKVPLSSLNVATPAHGWLQIEKDAGVLQHRVAESETLAELAKKAENYQVLAEATISDQLNAAWVGLFLDSATQNDVSILQKMAMDWLSDPQGFRRWGKLPLRIVDGLRQFRADIPEELANFIRHLGESLDVVNDWELYIRLADLLPPPDSNSDPSNGNPLMQRMLDDRWRIGNDEARKRIIEVAFDDGWRCLNPKWLLVLYKEESDKQKQQWDELLAEPFLNSEKTATLLDTIRLLRYLRLAGSKLNAERVQGVYARLTKEWRQDIENTTKALVNAGAWLGWRREAESNLTEEDPRKAAMAWLACPSWKEAHNPEPTLESWKQVMDDLSASGGLSGEAMRNLRCGSEHQAGVPWPRIEFFEEEQWADLAELCVDLDALVELVEIADSIPDKTEIRENSLKAYKKTHPNEMPSSFTGETLLWITETQIKELKPMDLPSSKYLLEHSGPYHTAKAEHARIESVLAEFGKNPEQALIAMEETKNICWNNAMLVDKCANWLGGDQVNKSLLDQFDKYISSKSRIMLPRPPTPIRRAAANRLLEKGYIFIANYLDKDVSQSLSVNSWYAKNIITALEKLDVYNQAWNVIASNDFQESKHPFLEVVEYNKKDKTKHLINDDSIKILEQSIKNHLDLLRHINSQYPTNHRLPIFELYASLSPEDRLAIVISQFVKHVYVIEDYAFKYKKKLVKFQEQDVWWVALLESIDKRRREYPSNSLERSIKAICETTNNILNDNKETKANAIGDILKINKALNAALNHKGYTQYSEQLILK